MLLLLAVLPGIVLFTVVWRQDKIEKEPAGLLLKLFIGGALTTASAMLLGWLGDEVALEMFEETDLAYLIIDNFLITALVEEGGKYFVLKKTTWRHSAFNYTFDAVVYAVTASLGFAVVENILYVAENGVATAIMRALLSVPGHVFMAIFMGCYYGLAKAAWAAGDRRGMKANLRKALWVPVLLHGLYDFCLSTDYDVLFVVFLIFDVSFTVAAIKRLKKLSKADAPILPEPIAQNEQEPD